MPQGDRSLSRKGAEPGNAPYYYPARTRLRVSKPHLESEVTPRLLDLELEVSVRYWEGAVEGRGTARGLPVTCRGYLELTGGRQRPARAVRAETD